MCRSTMTSVLNSASIKALPAPPSSRLRGSSPSSDRIAARNAGTSPGGTSTPLTPSRTASMMPPAAEATIGTPADDACSNATPSPSSVGGVYNQIEVPHPPRHVVPMPDELHDVPDTGGGQRSFHLSAVLPSPKTITRRRSGTLSRSASNRNLWPLRWISWAATPTVSASPGRPNSRRNSSRGAGSCHGPVSTAERIVTNRSFRTPAASMTSRMASEMRRSTRALSAPYAPKD